MDALVRLLRWEVLREMMESELWAVGLTYEVTHSHLTLLQVTWCGNHQEKRLVEELLGGGWRAAFLLTQQICIRHCVGHPAGLLTQSLLSDS